MAGRDAAPAFLQRRDAVPLRWAPMTPAAARPLWTRFLAFLGPLVLTNVLQALAGTVTTIYLGQLLGTRSLAAAVGLVLLPLVSRLTGKWDRPQPLRAMAHL